MTHPVRGEGRGLGVVVVNYGSSELLDRNLSRTAEGVPEAVIVVVDNFTTTTERVRVQQMCAAKGWLICEPDSNLGFGAGVNLGARRALESGAEDLLLLNPDAMIEADSITRLRGRVADDRQTMVAPRIHRPDGTVWFGGSDLHLDTGLLASTRRRSELPRGPVEPWLTGAVLVISRELWQEMGGFDERYFLYWEDVDLSHRILVQGGRLEVVPDAVAVHDEGGTHSPGASIKSDLYYYYNVRNRLLFAALHLEPERSARWVSTGRKAALEIVSRGGRRQYLRRGMGPLWAAVKGGRDGRRIVLGQAPPVEVGGTMTGPPTGRRLVVLQSFPAPRATTNPYIAMLADNLRRDPDLDVRTFTWREALAGRPDVVHAHWPENLVTGPSVPKRLAKQVLFGVALLRWRRQGTAVVRTRHNLELPSGISRRERALLTALDRQTNLYVRLNPTTAVPPGAVVETILHGHYRPWFAQYRMPSGIPGRIAYVGLVRRYKGVDALIRAFRGLTVPGTSLTISGKPSTPDLVQELEGQVDGDPRILLDLRFLPEADLVDAVGESMLVVLPYPEMHNSGTALLCLSLGRPVLVPDNPVNRGLRDEVGEGWVHLFEETLTSQHLETALESVNALPAAPPDLSRREWDGVAGDHVRAYRRAVSLVERRRKGIVKRDGGP